MDAMPSNDLKLDFALAAWGGEIGALRRILSDYPDAARWNDVGGGTALRKAVAHGSPHIEAVRLLIERGADIDAQDAEGFTPLMFAALHDARDVTKLLLEMEADTELADRKGRTAAQIAYETGYPEAALSIVAHAQGKRDAEAQKARAALEADVAQAHSGLDHRIAIRKPVAIRR